MGGYESYHGYWELNQGPLQKQLVLLTFRLSFQPPFVYCLVKEQTATSL